MGRGPTAVLCVVIFVASAFGALHRHRRKVGDEEDGSVDLDELDSEPTPPPRPTPAATNTTPAATNTTPAATNTTPPTSPPSPAVPAAPAPRFKVWWGEGPMSKAVAEGCPLAPRCETEAGFLVPASPYGPSNQIWALAELVLIARVLCRRLVLPPILTHRPETQRIEDTPARSFSSLFNVTVFSATVPVSQEDVPSICTNKGIPAVEYSDHWLQKPQVWPTVTRLWEAAGQDPKTLSKWTINKAEYQGAFFPFCNSGSKYFWSPKVVQIKTAAAGCMVLAAPLSVIAHQMHADPVPGPCDFPAKHQRMQCCRSQGRWCPPKLARHVSVRRLYAKFAPQPSTYGMLDQVLGAIRLVDPLQRHVDALVQEGKYVAVHARRMELPVYLKSMSDVMPKEDELCIGLMSGQTHCLTAKCLAEQLRAQGEVKGVSRFLLCAAPFGRNRTVGVSFLAAMEREGFTPVRVGQGLGSMEISLVEQAASRYSAMFVGTHDSSWTSVVAAGRRVDKGRSMYLSRLPCARQFTLQT
eukprot:Hpha_TRINITY_DN15370_c1_g3::TRINITY_DN15370_c1_g3_i1::g.87371::m.87371